LILLYKQEKQTKQKKNNEKKKIFSKELIPYLGKREKEFQRTKKNGRKQDM